MVAVVASGVIVGSFIYIQIPRTIEGRRELSLNEVKGMRSELASILLKERTLGSDHRT
jgi:hypothetical protein